MKRLSVLLFILWLFPAFVARAQSTDVITAHEWNFPKPGMATKQINGFEFYDLGDSFFARLDTLNSLQVAIIILPPNIAEDSIWEGQKIPSIDKNICALAVYKAVKMNSAKDQNYLTPVTRDNRVIHVFIIGKTSAVGASLSDDETFVTIMPPSSLPSFTYMGPIPTGPNIQMRLEEKLTSEGRPARPYEMGVDGVGRVQILYKEKGKYTDEAREAKIRGTVVLRALFHADGTISDISVIRGLSHGLNEKAIESAQRVQFKPAEKDGRPVSAYGQIEFTFDRY